MTPEATQNPLIEIDADLTRFLGEMLREQVPEEPTHLYHYTSIEGLVGIVATRKFFLSDMMASSDQSEILHGLGVVRDVLTEHRGDPIAESFLESFENKAARPREAYSQPGEGSFEEVAGPSPWPL